MTEADRQRDALETLKSFNNAIVNIRMYPAMAPQVTNAVERGYKAVKLYLRQHGDFVISREERKPILCGEELSEQIIQSLSNLIVFRQLETLGLQHLVIRSGIDRNAFGQILLMFTARVEKIKREGGGRDFAANLQLEEYFPEEYQYASPEHGAEADDGLVDLTLMPSVPDEYLSSLFGKLQAKEVVDTLKTRLKDPERAAEILAAAVGHVLFELQRQKILIAPPTFQTLLENIQTLVEVNDLRTVAMQASLFVHRGLKEKGLAVLLAQQFPKGFGALFFDALVSQTETGLFGRIVGVFRDQASSLRLAGDRNDPRLQLINETLTQLLNTGKGRHFLGLEKARSIIESGEKERQQKRVHAGVQSLLLGNLSGLQNDELVMGIPGALQQMLADGKNEEVTALLVILSDQLRDSDVATQNRIAKSLGIVGENLITAGRWDLLSRFAGSILQWFRTIDLGDYTFEKIAHILQISMVQAWKAGSMAAGDSILESFYQIRTGILRKSPPVRALVGRVQDQGIDKSALPALLKDYLANSSDAQLARRIIMQGPLVLRFLVDALLASENAEERIKISTLLSGAGQMLPPLLVSRLPEPMPWFCKRNLIKLLAETGGEQHVDAVMPFLTHEELRVQREAMFCLYNISGGNRRQVLLQMLARAGEILKPEIIKALMPFCDEEVVRALSELLDDQEFFTPDNRETLIRQICQTLGRCSLPQSSEALEKFLQAKGKRAGKKISQEVWNAAEEALAFIQSEQKPDKKRLAQLTQQHREATRMAGPGGRNQVKERESITGLPEEQAVLTFLAQGKTDSAKKLILDLIGRTARLRKFKQAENLRDWLIEIDAMALSEIIRSAEIIEEEKRAAIDKGHLEVWSALYDVLTVDEFSTLYHCLEHRRYHNEELIVSQGALQNSLFFINSGKVKLFFREEGSDILVKTMVPGEVLGAGTFFDASVWTISAASLGSSEISSLQLKDLERWKEEYPALESKLSDFCSSFERIDQFFKKSNRDRRQFKRLKISGRISAALLNSEGQNSGVSTKGELSDISTGGVSFFVRISKKENARLLLGRGVRVVLPGSEVSGQAAGRQGVIMAVRGYHVMENEYSVHVKFDVNMHHHELQRVFQGSPEGARAGL